MRKRFFWSVLLCLVAAVVLVPINLQLIDKAINSAQGTRVLNFFSLMFVELLLIFSLSFSVVNTYYTVHNEEGLFFTDKLKRDPEIPDKYLANTGGEGGVGGVPGGQGGEGGEGRGTGGRGGKGGKGGHG